MGRSWISAALTLLAAATVAAQTPGHTVATVAAEAAPVAHGGQGMLDVTVHIAPGYHINAHRPNDPSLIATTLQGSAPAGVKFGTPRFPKPVSVTVSYEKQPMLVYEGRAVIQIPFTVAKTVKPGRLVLSSALYYQGCNATSCFPPTTVPVRAVVIVR